MMVKISVITPIYKTESYLEKCLQSLINQTEKDIEFIWIDNDAGDECRDIISKYENSKKNIKVIHLDKNIGYCGAMNKGLEIATGEYIGFCDSDDFVDEDYYEKLYQKAKTTEAEIVYCGFTVEKEMTKQIQECKLRFCEREDLPLLEHLQSGTNWNGLFLRKFIQKNNLCFSTAESSIYRDVTFSIPAILLAKKTAITSETSYHYIIHKKSTTIGISNLNHCQATFDVLQEIAQKITPPEGLMQEALIRFLFRAFSIASLDHFPKEIDFLTQTALWKRLYKNQRMFSRPTFLQRIFSISTHAKKPLIKLRFLGMNFKIKTKGDEI